MQTTKTTPGETVETTVFGYCFRNAELLREALTTPSCKMENPDTRDNQRLEFLGDAVLGLLAADRLYAELPQEEGQLTVRRTHMVSATALCAAAARHDFVSRLVRNRKTAPIPSGSKTVADAIEAVIGAAWLDGGLNAARTIFDALELDANAAPGEWTGNPKGELQVRAQALLPPRHPGYELLRTTGKAHAPVFTVRVTVEGLGTATASAGSRRAAEAAAAATLLAAL